METKTDTLDSFFTTENEHWNKYAGGLHCKAVESGLFDEQELPLRLVDDGLKLLEQHCTTPANAIEELFNEVTKVGLSPAQQLFILNGIDGYLEITDFEENNLDEVQKLLKSHAKKLKAETIPAKPLVKNIREMLKDVVQKELQTLPDTLKGLEPEKRLSIVCKLMPFVMPKVDSIHSESGEPGHNPWG